MSVEQAKQLVKKASQDADFRAKLNAAPVADRRAILEENGFGDVKLRHMSQALPNSSGGELTDEEFAAVAGGGTTTTVVISAAAAAASHVAAAAGSE